jgi:large subunit ribosomal protein L21
MYAIIKTGGKQYRVSEGDVVFIEKLDVEEGAAITFEEIIAVGKEDGLVAGTPTVSGAKVTAKVLKNGKAKKVTVFTYRAKKGSKRKMGHRQPYTKIQIEKLEVE